MEQKAYVKTLLDNGRDIDFICRETQVDKETIVSIQRDMLAGKPEPIVIDEVKMLIEQILPQGYEWTQEQWEQYWNVVTVLGAKRMVEALMRPETKPETQLDIYKVLLVRSTKVPRLQEKEQPAVQINQDNRQLDVLLGPQELEAVGEWFRKVGYERGSESFRNAAHQARQLRHQDGQNREGRTGDQIPPFNDSDDL